MTWAVSPQPLSGMYALYVKVSSILNSLEAPKEMGARAQRAQRIKDRGDYITS